jgi:hypothetical protein
MEDWDTRAIIARALEEVDEEVDRSSPRSYLGLVPPEYRPAIHELVDSNFDYYASQYANDRSAFTEEMARNWLIKRKAFAVLAERSGLRRIHAAAGRGGLAHPNAASFAILTQNASYLLVGPGAFEPGSGGAAFRYRRIPLREGEPLRDLQGSAGLVFREPLTTGERAVTTRMNSSPVVAIYTTSVPSDESRSLSASLDDALGQTFAWTDQITVNRRRSPRAEDG